MCAWILCARTRTVMMVVKGTPKTENRQRVKCTLAGRRNIYEHNRNVYIYIYIGTCALQHEHILQRVWNQLSLPKTGKGKQKQHAWIHGCLIMILCLAYFPSWEWPSRSSYPKPVTLESMHVHSTDMCVYTEQGMEGSAQWRLLPKKKNGRSQPQFVVHSQDMSNTTYSRGHLSKTHGWCLC